MGQYEVLEYLKANPGKPVTAKELAAHFHKNTNTINHNIRALVKFYKNIHIDFFKRAPGKAGSSVWDYTYEKE